MKTTNIGIWGDSITYGAWDTEGGWADRLRVFLHARAIASKFEEYFWVYNLGIPGETSRDVLRRFEAECVPRTPHVVLFAAGINDSCRNGDARMPRVSLAEYRENLMRFADQALRVTPTVVFVGLAAVDEAVTQPFNNEDAFFSHEDMIAYNEVVSEVSKERGLMHIDLHNLLTPDDLFDGLHPNTEGHRKLFEHIKDFLLARSVV